MNGDRRELFHADGFAHTLGAELVESDSAWEVELTLAPQHLNFLGMCHGSVYFALSDIALSLVSNAEQTTAVAVDASISFMRSAREGDTL
jgi:acyl-CoA thioesterase